MNRALARVITGGCGGVSGDRVARADGLGGAVSWVARARASALKAESRPDADEPTTADSFSLPDGAGVTVPTMHSAGSLRYATGPGWRAVELAYAGGSLAMRVLVPTGSTSPAELLAPATLRAVRAGLHEENVALSLPRWDFHTDLDLGEALQRLGVHAAFDPNSADFSGISPRPLYIDQAVHRANVTVDESGTEAAAVTGLAFKAVSAMVPAAITVRVDRPFAFAIVDTTTQAPVFLGTVADPRAGR